MEYAVFVIGTSDEVGGFFYDRLCVFHGDSKTGIFDHGQIVEAVAAADHGIGSETDTVSEASAESVLYRYSEA